MKKIYLMLLLFVAGSLIQKAGHAQNIFYEDFELGVPGSFTQSFVAGTTSWLSTGGVPGAGVTFPYSGATSAIFYSAVANQNQTELISPVINMSSGAYNLKFYHVAASAGGGQFTRLAVFISNDGGTNWNRIDSTTTPTAAWTERTYRLDQFIGLGANMRIKFKGIATGTVNLGLDEIRIERIPTIEAGLTAMSAPVSGCGLDQENISVTIQNNGAGAILNMPMAYQINGGPVVVDTLTNIIFVNTSGLFTFATKGNFSTPGTYTIKAWMADPTDPIKSNDTISKTITAISTKSTFPYNQDFEAGATTINDFSPALGANASLTVDLLAANASTLGLHFGSRIAANAAGAWAANSAATTTATQAWSTYSAFQSKADLCVDATSVTGGLELRFDLKQTSSSGLGTKFSWFRVLVNGNPVSVDFNPTTQNADPFVTQSINLSQFSGTKFTVSFQSACRVGTGNNTDNAYVDNILLRTNSAADVGVSDIIGLTSGCGLVNGTPVTVNIHNYGFVPASNFPVNFTVGTQSVTETITDSIPAGFSMVYTFTTDSADFATAGSYLLTAKTLLTADADTTNNDFSTTIVSIASVDSLTYTQDFETGTASLNNFIMTNGINASYAVDAASANNSNFGLHFQGGNNNVTWPGGTATSTTAAQAWGLYTDYQNTASLCVDATNITGGIELLFDLRMTYSSTGPNYNWFRVLVDGNQISQDFNATTANSDPFTTQSLNLGAYAGTKFTLTFQSASKYSIASGVGAGDNVFLDNIVLKKNNTLDLEVSAISNIQSACDLPANQPISIDLKNNGFAPINSYAVSFKVDTLPAVTEIISIPLAAGAINFYTFMSTANLSATGSHIVKVWCHAPGDSIALNDTLQTTVISYPSRALPVSENFETGPAVFSNLNLQVNNLASVDVTNAAAKSGAYGFVMSGTFDRTAGGWTGGANNTTAIQAWANTDYHANAGFCVNAQSLSPGAPLEMFFDLRQTYSTGSTYSWMRVLINGVQFSPDFQPITQNSDPWERHRIDLSLFSGTSFEVTFQTANRFSLQFGLTDPGDNAFLDNIVIREPLPLDAGSLSLLAPSSDCGLDTAETVTLDIKNYGTQSISGFQVSYKLDNNPVVTETVSDTLAANAVLAYSFATKANLSAVGTHVLTLYTSLNGDGDANNDTIVITINNKPIIDTFPYSVDFENNSSGAFSIEPGEENNALISSTAANGSNLGFAMYGFNVNTTFTWNAATTFNTIVTNTTLNKRTGKIIACVDATNATSLELLFDLRQRFTLANNYSFLRVRVNGVTIQDVNMDSLYQPNTSNADPFRNLKFDLSSFAGTKFNLELQGFMKYSAGIVLGNQTFTDGDAVHIDNILLREKLPVDAGVIAISSPVAKCGLGATEDVVIDIKNFGISPLANVSASYSVNGATAITETVTPPQPIAAGATYTYTFTAKANLATAGVYNIKSWTSAINDGDNSNDTTSVTVSSTAAIAAFPYLENFETFTNSTNATGFANGWTTIPQNTTVLYRWNPDSGGTPTGGSGPNVDHTLGNATGKYLFTEASNPGGGQPALQEGDKAYVYSPCIDITTLTKPQLSFWYHMFGSQGGVVQMGNLYVLIEEGGVTTTVDSIIGQQQASNAAAWLNRTIDLSAFAGKTIRVVFMASRGSGALSDMAIDDVGIDNAPAIDMAATEVVSPGNGCFTANQDVVIRVKNQGAQIINFGFNNATIQTNITGVNPQNFTTIVNTGSLQPGATQDIVVATGYNMLAAGNYIINSSIVVLGDANAANNAIRATTFTQTTSGTTPQLVDFETFNGNNLATINAGWREATGATAPTGNTSAWRRSLTAHNTFYGDWNAIVTMFGNARNEWIVSPKIIPGSFDTLSFDLAVTDYLQGNTGSINKDLMGSDDSLNVMITTDCGLTWQLVRAITRANNIDSTFTTFKISMAPYGGKQISLGFYATTGSVVDPEQYELHLDQINISKATGTLSSFVLLTPANNSSAYIDGAPTNNLTATWQNAVSSFGSTDTVRYEFLLDVQGGNFSFPLLKVPADNAGAANQINIPYPAIANLLKTGGLNVGDSITLSWTVKAIPDSRVDTQWAAQPFNLTLKRGVITGLDALSDIEEYSVYPNPANGQVNIVYGLKARTNLNIAIYNTLGEKVMESTFNGVQNGVAQLNSLELPAGLYHIKMMTNNSTVTKKIVVQH